MSGRASRAFSFGASPQPRLSRCRSSTSWGLQTTSSHTQRASGPRAPAPLPLSGPSASVGQRSAQASRTAASICRRTMAGPTRAALSVEAAARLRTLRARTRGLWSYSACAIHLDFANALTCRVFTVKNAEQLGPHPAARACRQTPARATASARLGTARRAAAGAGVRKGCEAARTTDTPDAPSRLPQRSMSPSSSACAPSRWRGQQAWGRVGCNTLCLTPNKEGPRALKEPCMPTCTLPARRRVEVPEESHAPMDTP
jgi:hypothetical protein